MSGVKASPRAPVDSPVTYEVKLVVDNAVREDFDAWLATHIDEMLAIDGFIAAETITPDPPDEAHSVRIVRYRLASRAHLDRYLAEHAERMRAAGLERFGERCSASREVYGLDGKRVGGHRCRNCDTPLAGQYCVECGQRDEHRIVSLWELLRDAAGDIFDVDSRIWRTLIPLLLRPGLLTLEYLRGRRMRYTPPVRLYLVTSLVFFVVAFFGTDTVSPTITVDPDPTPAEQGSPAANGDAPAGSPTRAEPATSGDANAGRPETGGDDPCADIEIGDSAWETALETRVRAACERERDGLGPPRENAVAAALEEQRDGCQQIDFASGAITGALEKRARRACEQLTAEGGLQRFGAEMIDNVPGMMFLFLPVIALIMKFLYPFARRFYVEHLLFFVHFHAFFFVLATVTLLLSRVPDTVPGQSVAATLAMLTTIFYTPAYLFVAQRRVYGQGRLATFVKFGFLLGAYFVSLVLLVALLAMFTALSL